MATNLGEVDVSSLNLVSMSSGKQQDISGQSVVLSLYEDVVSPTIVADITILDGVGLLRTFPIVGSEWVDIEFATKGRQPYKIRLQVFEVRDVIANDNQTAYSYTIRAVSEEKVRSVCENVEKSYNQPIDAIVRDILESKLKTDKKLFYEQTKGAQHLVFTRRTPFEAINMLKTRAVSQKRASSTFLFFENRYGYNFTTLEELADKNKGVIGDKRWTKNYILNDKHQQGVGFRTILSYNTGRQFNMLQSIEGGALYNIHNSFDLITKSVKTTEYKLDQFPSFAQPDDDGVSPFTPEVYQRHGKTTSVQMFNVFDSSRPDTYIPDTQGMRLGYNGVHLNNAIAVHVYGDSSVSVGDVIQIEVPVTDSSTKTRIVPEPLMPGNYIVTQVHHCIQFSATKPKHTTTMSIVRGTYKSV